MVGMAQTAVPVAKTGHPRHDPPQGIYGAGEAPVAHAHEGAAIFHGPEDAEGGVLHQGPGIVRPAVRGDVDEEFGAQLPVFAHEPAARALIADEETEGMDPPRRIRQPEGRGSLPRREPDRVGERHHEAVEGREEAAEGIGLAEGSQEALPVTPR